MGTLLALFCSPIVGKEPGEEYDESSVCHAEGRSFRQDFVGQVWSMKIVDDQDGQIDRCQPGCVCDSGSFFRRKSTFHVNE